jgi:signal transduction histidine kinase
MEDLRRAMAELKGAREQLVLAREEERRRLRRDLHDDLAPTLAGLAITAGTIQTLIPTNPAKAADLVREQQSAIREAVSNIRRLVYDLRPPTLDELGLLAAVHERAAQYSTPELAIRVEAPAALPALPAAVEVAVYRIVQEALMNVLKHAQARNCSVRLTLADTLVVEIMDDGKGVANDHSAGVGLRSMRERAAELGGMCTIERLATHGTRLIVNLPLDAGSL